MSGHLIDAVLHLMCGPRPSTAHVAAHIAASYAVPVEAVVELDNAWRVDLASERWVVRAFDPVRSVEEVTVEAELLCHLEAEAIPAERCAHPQPVTVLDGHPILVTRWVDGDEAPDDDGSWIALAAWAGRLATAPAPPTGLARDVGAYPNYTPRGSLADEVVHALACLHSVTVQPEHAHVAATLAAALDRAIDVSRLPTGLVHADLAAVNAFVDGTGQHIPVDWAGGGAGPRLVTFAVLLGHGGVVDGAAKLDRVTSMAAAFGQHLQLTAEELAALPELVRRRPLVKEAIGLAIGAHLGGSPLSIGLWSGAIGALDAVSAAAVDVLGGSARRFT